MVNRRGRWSSRLFRDKKATGKRHLIPVFTFIGGRIEHKDKGYVDGIKREKNEEVGNDCEIKLFTTFTINNEYIKKDGSRMILPHFLAIYIKGNIILSSEYSQFEWVEIDKLDEFEPKYKNIPFVIDKMLENIKWLEKDDYVII